MYTIKEALKINNTSKITRNVIKLMVEGTNIKVNESAEHTFHKLHCNKFNSGVSLELPIVDGGFKTLNFKTTKDCALWIEHYLLKLHS